MNYTTFRFDVEYMFMMYVSLCGLPPVGCNWCSYSENYPKVAANAKLSQASAKYPYI